MVYRNKSSLGFANRSLENLPAPDRLLLLLKTRGDSTAAKLGKALGISGEAARQQLQRLQQAGLVEAISEVRGVGRPVQIWKLTPAANQRFPDAHPELTRQLLETIRRTLGEKALDRLIDARGEELTASYGAALENTTGLKERIARLVSLRNAEGYMAEWRPEKDGFLIIENHCPICAASGVCLKLCRSELDLFSKLLGPQVTVRRQEHMVNGSRRCVYSIQRNRPGQATGGQGVVDGPGPFPEFS